MTINYYYHWLSPPCKTVSMVIKHLNITDVNYILIDNLYNKESRDERLLKVNPIYEIPTIDDNGFHLAESCAIAQYLCDKHAPDNNLYPKDIQKRAQVDRMLFFAAGTFFPAMRAYGFPKLVLGVEPPKEAIEQWKEKISLLNTLIGNKKYVAADHLTIADLSLYSITSLAANPQGFMVLEAVDLNEFPNLKKWLETISAEYPQLFQIASTMDGLEELKVKIQKNFGVTK